MNNSHQQRTACVLGSTGLVGRAITESLAHDDTFTGVKLLVRTPSSRKVVAQSDKLTEHVIDFDAPKSYAEQVSGDVLFCAFGTTLKKAGSKERQYQIDVTYQLDVCKAAVENGVRHLILVSSLGADSGSRVFYSRIKGELEDAVNALMFDRVDILQPSILDGEREARTGDKRTAESLGIQIGRWMRKAPLLNRYAAIKDTEVARAMIALSKEAQPGRFVHENYVLMQLGKITQANPLNR